MPHVITDRCQQLAQADDGFPQNRMPTIGQRSKGEAFLLLVYG